jgi:hypothetical protein
MAQFMRCQGKAYCVEETQGCKTCRRSVIEIETTRSLIAQAAQFVLEQDYANVSEFARYLGEKIEKRVRHARKHIVRTGAD